MMKTGLRSAIRNALEQAQETLPNSERQAHSKADLAVDSAILSGHPLSLAGWRYGS
jgi:hypothetical protein